LYTEADWLRFNKLCTDKIIYSLDNSHNNIFNNRKEDYYVKFPYMATVTTLRENILATIQYFKF